MAPKNIEDKLYWTVASGLLEIDEQGRVWRTRPRRRRAEKRTTAGYLQVRVMTRGVRHCALAHRLVWRHFNGQIPDGLTVNHINGTKSDNAPSNLELATYSGQVIHALRVLKRGRLTQKGAANVMAKLTPEKVAEIRRRRATGERLKTIAADYDVSDRAISKVALGHRWTG